MDITYEYISEWMDNYFKTVRENMGPLETVPKIGKLFTEDFEFVYYTPPSTAEFTWGRASREELLMMMVHPGLAEVITPKYYAINLKEMVCVVRFDDRTVDTSTGNDLVPSFQASAHYHLVTADDTGLKIGLLEYWTENQTPENIEITQEAWFKHSKPAFEGIIFDWLKSRY